MNKRKSIDLVIITGPSGAGRTTALDALEDLGFEAFDIGIFQITNLLRLLIQLILMLILNAAYCISIVLIAFYFEDTPKLAGDTL